MKIEFEKKLSVTIAMLVASNLTILFSVLSIFNVDQWIFRTFSQGSLSLVMLFYGIDCFVYRKQKLMGICFWIFAICDGFYNSSWIT